MRKIALLIFLFCSITVFAQQDPLFTQYTFNKLLVNPAYAGSKEDLDITLLSRAQWVNIEGAPETYTLSAHSSFNKKRVGLGFYMFRDVLGATVNNGLMGTYAYRLLMGRSSFSFGMQFGVKYYDFDWNAMNLKDEDVVFAPQDVRKVIPDLNLGVYFQSNRFFAGLSSKQLLENDMGLSENSNSGSGSFSRLARHFYFMTGAAIPMDNKIVFKPSALVKYTENAPVQFDFNASFLLTRYLLLGASYRTLQAITFMTELTLTETIKLGYSYDVYLNELQPFNFGSHEIRVEFDFGMLNTRMRTPRYF